MQKGLLGPGSRKPPKSLLHHPKSGTEQGVISKEVFSLEESLESLKSLNFKDSLGKVRFFSFLFHSWGFSRGQKLNTNFIFSNFSGTSGISRQNPGISRKKSLISLVSRDMSNFLAPTPSRGRPLPHRKISGFKRLGLGSFFLPDSLGSLEISQTSRNSKKWTSVKRPLFQKTPFSEPDKTPFRTMARQPHFAPVGGFFCSLGPKDLLHPALTAFGDFPFSPSQDKPEKLFMLFVKQPILGSSM